MSEKRLRRRTPVRYKQVREIVNQIKSTIDSEFDISSDFLEKGHYEGKDVLLVDRKIVAFLVTIGDNKFWFPTLRGILQWMPNNKWASIDRGAIPFLMNGADCMGAGIHLADVSIKSDELIWIKDQEHGKPIAIGISIVNGQEMIDMKKGKAIETIHWIGDELWELET